MSLEADVRVTLTYAAGVKEYSSYTLDNGDLKSGPSFAKEVGKFVTQSIADHLRTANEYDRTIYGVSVEFGYRMKSRRTP
jgi:hypothetical protein